MTTFESLEPRRLMSVNVTTSRYDNTRSGANTNETQLTLADVNKTTFGKVASMSVDAQIYAQPLVMTGVAISGQGTHDIVLVATENDTVYAFDAYGNNPSQGYLWKTSLLQNGETAVPQADYGTTDITPLVGVTGTPVIDPATNTLYVVGLFKETNATYVQRLYALDITSGASKVSPMTISASVPGTGSGSSGGNEAFNAFMENQRPALTLANGEVYVAWASHADVSPWHGWLIAFNKTTLHEDYVYDTTPNGDAGGIWMSGGGLAVDSSGDLYFTTGNGTFDANSGGSDYSMAIEKLSPTLGVLDYFAPYNEASLNSGDLDYGCSDAILLPTQSGSAPNEVLTAGKWGTLYLNNSNTGSMGEFSSTTNHDLSEANTAPNVTQTNLRATISYWNGHVYIANDAAALKGYNVSGGTITGTSFSQSSNVFGASRQADGSGASPTISSNGTSNGIAWALDNSGFTSRPAVLYAYNANNLSQTLWTSSQAAGGRDTAGNAVKFQSPVVANGHVYVAGANSVTVYGILAPASATPTIVTAASANPSPVIATTTNLSVAAFDQSGDAAPTYTWATTTAPSGATAPTFSINGTASAGTTTVTFFKAGSYTFTATITDSTTNLTVTSSVAVTVSQTVTGITVSTTGSVSLFNGQTSQFSATSVDQFGNTITAPTLLWTVSSGVGSVSNTGLYTAPATGAGSATVQAASGGIVGQATVQVLLPTWLGNGSAAVWNSATKVLNVTGTTSIMADPGSDQPIIQGTSSLAVITIAPTSGNLVHIGGLNLSGGAVVTVPTFGTTPATAVHRALVLGLPNAGSAPTLNIDSSSELDLNDNDLIVHSQSLAVVNTLLQRGDSDDSWGGKGISSSVCDADDSDLTMGDGAASATGTFDGEAVTTSDIEVRFTVDCDATFDGIIDSDDYARINAGFAASTIGFANGDFNYDGVINGSDFSLIDSTYNTESGSSSSEIAKPAAKVVSAIAPAAGVSVSQAKALVPVAALFSSAELFAGPAKAISNKTPAAAPPQVAGNPTPLYELPYTRHKSADAIDRSGLIDVAAG